MATSLAKSALQRFIQKRTPDNIAPPKLGDEKMGDGFFKPGVVDNKSAVVQWLSEDSGPGIVPEEALTKPIEFEAILDFIRKLEGCQLAKSINSDSLIAAEEHQLQSFLYDTEKRAGSDRAAAGKLARVDGGRHPRARSYLQKIATPPPAT